MSQFGFRPISSMWLRPEVPLVQRASGPILPKAASNRPDLGSARPQMGLVPWNLGSWVRACFGCVSVAWTQIALCSASFGPGSAKVGLDSAGSEPPSLGGMVGPKFRLEADGGVSECRLCASVAQLGAADFVHLLVWKSSLTPKGGVAKCCVRCPFAQGLSAAAEHNSLQQRSSRPARRTAPSTRKETAPRPSSARGRSRAMSQPPSSPLSTAPRPGGGASAMGTRNNHMNPPSADARPPQDQVLVGGQSQGKSLT